MSPFARWKSKILPAVFIISGVFLFCSGVKNAEAFKDAASYQKPSNGTLESADWNNLLNDFVTTWTNNRMDGTLGIGMDAPASGLSVNGPVVANSFCLGGTCLSNWDGMGGGAFWDGTLSGNVWNKNTGNLGIGTTEPGAKLDISGSLRGTSAITFNLLGGNGNALVMTDNNGTIYSTNTAAFLSAGSLWSGTKDSNIWNGNSGAGNVGIGITNPWAKLFVNSSGGRTLYTTGVWDVTGSSSIYDNTLQTTITPTTNEVNGKDYVGLKSSLIIGNTPYTFQSGDQARSFYMDAEYQGSQTFPDLRAAFTDVYNTNSGTVTNAYNLVNQMRNTGSGTIGSAFGVDSRNPVNSGGGTIGNYYGFYYRDATTPTNAYAFYSGQNSGTGKRYGLYMAGTAPNYFNGSVGIGTTNPGNKLDVVQTGSVAGVRVSGGTNPQIRLEGTTAQAKLQVCDGCSGGLNDSGNGIGLFGTENAYPFAVYTNNVERLRIMSTGNVGINTTNPSAKLDVAGSLRGSSAVTFNLLGGNGNSIVMADNTGTLYSTSTDSILVPIITANGLWSGTKNGNIWNGDAGVGKVGIGTTNPGALLEVSTTGTANNLRLNGTGSGVPGLSIAVDGTVKGYWAVARNSGQYFTDATPGDMAFRSESNKILFGQGTGNSTMTINAGNVGIGTTTPGVRLQVNGGDQAGPTLGSSVGGFALTGSNNRYGMYVGVSLTGDTWLQSQRNDNSTNVYNLLLNPSGGNVGIGTTTPSTKLDVLGSLRGSSATTFSLLGNNGNAVVMTDNTGTIYSTSTSSFFSTNSLWSGTKNGNIWNGDAGAGNVGIGTTNPTFTLDIFAPSGYASQRLISSSSAAFIQMYGTGGWPAGVTYGANDGSGKSWLLGMRNTTGPEAYQFWAEYYNGSGSWIQPLKLMPSGNVLMNAGNVGIGTTTPSQLLTVGNNNQFTVTSGGIVTATQYRQAGGYNKLSPQFSDSSGVTGMSVNNNGAFFSSNNNSIFAFNQSGGMVLSSNVGFGWAQGAADGYNNDVAFSRLSAGKVALGNGTVGDYTGTIIAGNVGIGTTTPSTKLDVLGSLRGSSATTFSLLGNNGNAVVMTDNTGTIYSTSTSSFFNANSLWSGTKNGNIWNGDAGAGNVGIGTTNPEANIHIAANDFTSSVMDSAGGTWWYGNYDYFRRSRGTLSNRTAVQDGDLIVNHNYQGYDGSNWQAGAGFQVRVDGAVTSGIVPMQYYIENRGADGTWRQNLVIRSTGNVGIGTTNPAARLDVNGNILLPNNVALQWRTNTGVIRDVLKLSNGDTLDLNSVGILAFNNGNYFVQNNPVSYAETLFTGPSSNIAAMTWGATGNVGIGTTTPGTKLDIIGSLRANSATFSLLGNGGNQIVMTDNSGNLYATSSSIASGIPSPTGLSGQTLRSDGTNWVANSLLYNNGTNVGIGTTSPQAGLDVENGPSLGTALFYNPDPTKYTQVTLRSAKGTDGSSDTYLLNILNPTGSVVAGIRSDGIIYGTGLGTNDNITAALNQSGNNTTGLGLGSAAGIQWSNGTGSGNWWTAKDLSLSRGAAGRLYVGNGTIGDYTGALIAGNVGIGTTTPSTKLDVLGSLRGSSATTFSLLGNNGNAVVMTDNTGTIYSTSTSSFFGANSLWSGTKNGNIWNGDAGAGNVGIGTTNPTHLLQISSSTLVTNSIDQAQVYIQNTRTSGSGHASIVVDKGRDADSATFGFSSASLKQWDAGIIDGNNYVIRDNHGSNNLKIFTLEQNAPDNSFYLASSGSVGIGTATPPGQLSVNSDITGSIAGGTMYNMLDLQANSANHYKIYGSDSDANLGLVVSTPNTAFRVDVGSRLGDALLFGSGNSGGGNNTFFSVSRTAATGGKVQLDAFNSGVGGADLLLNSRFGSGNVGVNTTNPGTRLDVAGSLRGSSATTFSLLGNNGNAVVMTDNTGTIYSTSTSSFFNANSLWSGTKNGNIWNGDAGAGNVGIGTSTPNAKLDVVGAIRSTQNTSGYSEFTHANAADSASFPRAYFKIYGGGSENNSALYVAPGNALGTTMQPVFLGLSTNSNVKQSGSKQALLYLANNAFSLVTTDAENSGGTKIPWYLGGTYTNGSDADLTLAANGNVGIGTTNPVAPLDVNGSATGANMVLNVTNTASNTWLGAFGFLAPNMVAGQNYGFTVGKSASAYNRAQFEYHHVADGSTSNYLGIGFNGADFLLNVLANGNVGIGTTTPSTKLDVLGSLRGSSATTFSLLGNNGNAVVMTDNTGTIYSTSTSSFFNANSLWSGTKNGNIWNGDAGVGNVGIGTTTPANKLDVEGAASFLGNIMVRNSSINNTFSITNATTAANAGIANFAFNNSGTGYNTYTFKGANSRLAFENTNDGATGSFFMSYNTFQFAYNNYNVLGLTQAGKVGSLVSSQSASPTWRNLLDDSSGNGYISGNLGVGTTTPGTKLDIIGSLRANSATFSLLGNGGNQIVMTDNSGNLYATSSSIASGIPSPSGLTGQTLRSDGTNWVANSLLYNNGTNVGIGTTNPGSMLTVNGPNDKDLGPILNLSGNAVNQFESGRVRFTETTVAAAPYYQGAFFHYDGSSNVFNIGVHENGDAQQSSDINSIRITRSNGNVNIGNGALFTQYNGNVGIGTTNPVGISTYPTLHLEGASGSGIRLRTTGSVRDAALYTDASGFNIWTGNTDPIRFHVNNDVKMVVINSGNVGIGTTTPSTKLDVLGSLRGSSATTFSLLGNNGNAVVMTDNTGTIYSTSTSSFFGANSLWSGTKNGNIWNGDAGVGNVGIGTTAPGAKLAIQGTGTYNSTNWGSPSDVSIRSSEMGDNAYHSILQLVSVRQSLTTGKDSNGYLGFSTIDDSNAQGMLDAGRIAIVNEAGSSRNSATALSFWTNPGGANDAVAATEKLRIASSGNVGIGTTNPTTKLQVNFGDAAGNYLGFQGDNTTNGAALWTNWTTGSSYLDFRLGGTSSSYTKMRIQNDGNVGIGTTTPSTKLDVLGSLRGSSATTFSLLGNNGNAVVMTDNTGTIYSTSTSSFFGANSLWSGTKNGNIWNGDAGVGNVGIGTTNPSNKLDVIGGDINSSGSVWSGWGSSYIKMTAGYPATINTYDGLGINVNNSATRALTINTSGNVGIGTSNPGSKLMIVDSKTHVSGDLGPNDAILRLYNNYNNDVAGKGAVITFEDNYLGTNRTTRAAIKGGTATAGNTADGFLAFYTDAAGADSMQERMRIDQNGNVGIGTATPSTKLDVLGSLRNSGATTHSLLGGSGNAVVMTDNTGTLYTTSTASFLSSGSLWSGTKNGNIWNGDAGVGNVGIGTTSPAYKFDVNGNARITGGLYIGDAAKAEILAGDNDLHIRGLNSTRNEVWINYNTGGNGAFRFAGGDTTEDFIAYANGNGYFRGNVGIGTTNPGAKLDVLGTNSAIVFRTASTNGQIQFYNWNDNKNYIESTDASGTASQLLYFTGQGGSAGTFAFNGNVGIGTTNPGAKFVVRPATDVNFRMGHSGTGRLVTEVLNDALGGYVAQDNYASVFSFNVGNVGIGTTTPGTKVDIIGSLRANSATFSLLGNGGNQIVMTDNSGNLYATSSSIASGIPSPSGLTGQTLRSDGTNWVANSLLYNNGTNVGIGTVAPVGKLNIVGSAGAGQGIQIDNSEIKFRGDGFAHYSILNSNGLFSIANTSSNSGMGAASTSLLSIQSGGNVGIGTTNPLAKLQILGGKLYVNQNTSNPQNTSYNTADLVIGDNTSTRNGYGGTNGSHIFLQSSDKSSITALDENNNLGQISYQNLRWTIGEDIGWGAQTIYMPGTVGIGTTTPSTKLDVLGSLRNSGATTHSLLGGSGNVVVMADNTGTLYTTSTASFLSSGSLWSGTKNGNIWNGDAGVGNVGIGITNPTQKLDVVGNIKTSTGIFYSNNTTFQFRNDGGSWLPIQVAGVNSGDWTNTPSYGEFITGSDYDLKFKIQGVTRLFIDKTAGNVGIGTTNPGSKLQLSVSSSTAQSLVDGFSSQRLEYDGGWNTGDTGAQITFAQRYSTSDSALVRTGAIRGIKTFGTGSFGGGLQLLYQTNAAANMAPGLTLAHTGYIGIGTTAPGAKLDVAGFIQGNSTIKLPGLAGMGNVIVMTDNTGTLYATSTAGFATSTLPYLPLAGGTMTGSINMNSWDITNIHNLSVDKISATTIDPLYSINGINYSTFASSIAGGVKEEYVGKAELKKKVGREYEAVIDFSKLDEGDDLWVWKQVIEYSRDGVDVFITPYGGLARTYYLINGNKLIFRADRPTEISYRLVGKRFDWRNWPTRALDQKTSGFKVW